MNIQIIGESTYKLTYWQNAFELAAPPSFKIGVDDWPSLIDPDFLETTDIVFLTSYLEDLEYKSFINLMKQSNVSIILNDFLSNSEISRLLEKGVKAVINEHISIEKISSMLDVVTRGGVYYLPADEDEKELI